MTTADPSIFEFQFHDIPNGLIHTELEFRSSFQDPFWDLGFEQTGQMAFNSLSRATVLDGVGSRRTEGLVEDINGVFSVEFSTLGTPSLTMDNVFGHRARETRFNYDGIRLTVDGHIELYKEHEGYVSNFLREIQ